MQMLYITAVKPKHPQKGDKAIFYLRDSVAQKTIILEERVGHLFATKKMPHADASSLVDKLRRDYPNIDEGAYPEERVKVRPYSQDNSVVHLYGDKEDKENLPPIFLRDLKKCFNPHSCYFSHEEARKRLQELEGQEEFSHLDFSVYQLKGRSYIEVTCEKGDLKKLPGYFKKYWIKSKDFDDKVHADYYKERWQKRLMRSHDQFSLSLGRKKEHGKDKYYVKAICTKRGLDLLKHKEADAKLHTFHAKDTRTDPQKLNSYQRMLNYRFPVFSTVEIKDGRIDFSKFDQFNQPRVGLEEVISDKKCAIDIETQDYDTPDEKIFMAIFRTEQENVLYTIHDPGKRSVNGAEVVLCEDEKDLVMRLAEKERSFDPLFVIGHNLQAFDRMKLKHIGRKYGKYAPGANEDEPRMRSSSTGKVETLSRFEIDTLYLKKTINYLESNKLEPHAQRAGIDFRKNISYEEMAKLVQDGYPESIFKVADYTVNDGGVSLELGNWCLENVLLKSYLFRRSPTDICKTSDKNLSNNLRARQYFRVLNTFRDAHIFNIAREKQILDLDQLKFEFLDIFEGRTGKFNDAQMVYYPMFVDIFSDIVDYNEDAAKIRKRAKEVGDKDLQFDLLQTLVAFLAEPITDMKNYLEKYKRKLGQRVDPYEFYDESDEKTIGEKSRLDWILGKAYGSNNSIGNGRSVNIIDWNNRLCDGFDALNEKIRRSGFINGRRMLFFEDFNQENAIDYGRGFLVSLPNQRYVGIFNDNFVMEGLRLKKRGEDKKRIEQDVETMKKFLISVKDGRSEEAERLVEQLGHDDLVTIARTALTDLKPPFNIKGRDPELPFSNNKV
ncbi:3'-5' exonuclease [Nanoarchaeota archaeon]